MYSSYLARFKTHILIEPCTVKTHVSYNAKNCITWPYELLFVSIDSAL